MAEIGGAAGVRELAERYADGVDRRAFDEVAALFRPDGVLLSPGRRRDEHVEHVGRDAVASALRGVEGTVATMHAITGQVVDVEGNEAAGRISCLAHHVLDTRSGRQSHVWIVRYADRYAFADDRWWFVRREVQVRWIESHPVTWTAEPPTEHVA